MRKREGWFRAEGGESQGRNYDLFITVSWKCHTITSATCFLVIETKPSVGGDYKRV